MDEGNSSIHRNGMEGKETQHQLEPGWDKVLEKGGSGGMQDGVVSGLSGSPAAEVLIQGSLYVVVTEQWEEIIGFEVWELEEDVGGVFTLGDELMLQLVRGRKWVHDIKLLEKGQPTEAATDLPDKPTGGGKLGKKGQRRFAPATTRRWAEFVNIQPAQWGGVWLKIRGEKLEMFKGRLSFVLKSQVIAVQQAYASLYSRDDEDE